MTPDGSGVTMWFVAAPMMLLYLIWIIAIHEEKKHTDNLISLRYVKNQHQLIIIITYSHISYISIINVRTPNTWSNPDVWWTLDQEKTQIPELMSDDNEDIK
jgi:hypothetical protein